MSASTISVPEATVDPVATAQQVQIYAKTVAGVTQFFTRASNGTITQLTPGAGGSSIPNLGGDVTFDATIDAVEVAEIADSRDEFVKS